MASAGAELVNLPWQIEQNQAYFLPAQIFPPRPKISRRGRRFFANPRQQIVPPGQQISHLPRSLPRQAWTRNTKWSAIGSSYFSEYFCTESVSISCRENCQSCISSPCARKMTWSTSNSF
ncbi:hypothetical protein V6N11_037759 [Hibiscus sabdariffa]|uniref:Uncharacterized protein n=1 Tax=Hibiscus sabdariffa TaxID=183260 RepID=A0ABR2PEF3_9ROSI